MEPTKLSLLKPVYDLVIRDDGNNLLCFFAKQLSEELMNDLNVEFKTPGFMFLNSGIYKLVWHAHFLPNYERHQIAHVIIEIAKKHGLTCIY
jgi:uncharacterized protein with von Willebrand factor type A (vWA) domain